jgi:hypothetical protein
MTPSQLIEARFNWLQQGDFSSVYRSYHVDSHFIEQFPKLDDYLALVNEQGLDKIEVHELKLLAKQCRGSFARVLSFQSYRFQALRHSSLEITTLRLDEEWKVLSSKRVGCDENIDLDAVSWKNVDSNPDAISI